MIQIFRTLHFYVCFNGHIHLPPSIPFAFVGAILLEFPFGFTHFTQPPPSITGYGKHKLPFSLTGFSRDPTLCPEECPAPRCSLDGPQPQASGHWLGLRSRFFDSIFVFYSHTDVAPAFTFTSESTAATAAFTSFGEGGIINKNSHPCWS